MTTTKEPASTATGKLSLAEILAVFFGGTGVSTVHCLRRQ